MQRFILIRVIQAIITIFIISGVIFVLARMTGDPTALMLPFDATKEDAENMRRALGLDKPLAVQYQIFLVNALRGDFGKSIRARRPVLDVIKDRLPNSAKLSAVAFLLGYLIAFPLGITAAYRKGSRRDGAARVIAGLGQAVPGFWLSIILIEVFAVQLRLLPTSGMGGLKYYILPASVWAFIMMPGVIRLLRSSMLDVLDSEYIKFARIKGAPEKVVVWKHAFKNALLPVVGFTGVQIARGVVGAIIIETVFAWPGFGRLAYEAVMARDYPLMQGVVLVAAAIVLVANLVVDIAYSYLDPRVRYT